MTTKKKQTLKKHVSFEDAKSILPLLFPISWSPHNQESAINTDFLSWPKNGTKHFIAWANIEKEFTKSPKKYRYSFSNSSTDLISQNLQNSFSAKVSIYLSSAIVY